MSEVLNNPAPENLPEEAMVSRSDRLRAWLLRQRGVILFLICFASLLGFIIYHHWDVTQVSEEAVIRSGVGTDLLDGLASGRQGLVGSLVWAPLPTIVGLPLVYVPELGATGLAWPVITALISALTIALLNRWLRQAGLHWLVRYPVLIGYQFCPPVLGAVLAGSSAILLIAFFVAGLHFLHNWLVTLDVRSLAYAGSLAALAVVTDWRMIALLLAVLLVVICRLLYTSRPRGFSQAVIVILLVPALYLAAAWTLSNWLIMGNPFAFFRGILSGASVLPSTWSTALAWHLYLLAPLVLFLGLVYARALNAAKFASLVLGPAVVLAMLVVVAFPYCLELSGASSYLQMYLQRVHTVDEIVSFLEDRYPDSRVVVSGYYGYVFRARAHRPDLFVHCINLSLGDIDHRTHGKELFILLPRPEGTRTWEDVFLSHPGLFTGYENYRMSEGPFVAGFIFQESWPADDGKPQWLLLRMVLRRAGESS